MESDDGVVAVVVGCCWCVDKAAFVGPLVLVDEDDDDLADDGREVDAEAGEGDAESAAEADAVVDVDSSPMLLI